MRTLAIGDVHGCSTVLDDLLAAVRPTPDDRLVFLGDYVDRGPDTRGTLDRLIRIRDTFPHAVFLRGNHELMMTRSRTDRGEARGWLSVGGREALGSYGPSPGRTGTLADVPDEHWRFLERDCRDWFETDTHIFVHANLDADLPLADQCEEALFWRFLDTRYPIGHVSGKTVICGHTSQRSGAILDLGTTVCIDTHAYAGGWLTCLEPTTGRFWQASVIGKVRTGFLGDPNA